MSKSIYPGLLPFYKDTNQKARKISKYYKWQNAYMKEHYLKFIA